MSDEALVTLIIGAATVFGAVVATVTAVVVEWRRSRYQERRERRLAVEVRAEQREQEVRTALVAVRASLRPVSPEAQLTAEMRRNANARLDDGDLPQQIRSVRTCHPAAVTTLEALWTLCPGASTRTAIDRLIETISWVFRCTRSAGGQSVEAEEIERRVQERLRALSTALTEEEDL